MLLGQGEDSPWLCPRLNKNSSIKGNGFKGEVGRRKRDQAGVRDNVRPSLHSVVWSRAPVIQTPFVSLTHLMKMSGEN